MRGEPFPRSSNDICFRLLPAMGSPPPDEQSTAEQARLPRQLAGFLADTDERPLIQVENFFITALVVNAPRNGASSWAGFKHFELRCSAL